MQPQRATGPAERDVRDKTGDFRGSVFHYSRVSWSCISGLKRADAALCLGCTRAVMWPAVTEQEDSQIAIITGKWYAMQSKTKISSQKSARLHKRSGPHSKTEEWYCIKQRDWKISTSVINLIRASHVWTKPRFDFPVQSLSLPALCLFLVFVFFFWLIKNPTRRNPLRL